MKTALVWGAGGGVGQALTAELAQNGWQVVALGRHLERISEIAYLTVEADVADEYAVRNGIMAAGMEIETGHADPSRCCSHFPLGQSAHEAACRRPFPRKIAKRILKAYHEGYTGQLDLV